MIYDIRQIMKVNLTELCIIFAISRQAYYQSLNEAQKKEFELELIFQKIFEIRKVHKRKGGRKLYKNIKLFLDEHGIKMGRDMFFKFLRNNNLLIRVRKLRAITTDSKHWYKKYPNLIKEFIPFAPNRLWVSDITYVRYGNTFAYLSLITDAYSRKIMGFSVRGDLKAKGPLDALKMAIKSTGKDKLEGLIHHSDRGVQYCCDEYIAMLKKAGILISMTQNGDPLENAIAERVNGIVKNEYELERLKTIKEVHNRVSEAVFDYNNNRMHNSINDMTPNDAHQICGLIPRLWKTKIYSNETPNRA